MICDGCNNKEAHRISYSSGKECCDRCGASNTFRFSDVFFKQPYWDNNICDPKKAPFGMEITSRSHKALIMKENGLREHGDKRHGARTGF